MPLAPAALFGDYATTPVVVHGVVYTQDLLSNVIAIDLATGRVVWKHTYDLGFWGAREVFPEAREGRCWFHKTANVLAALPKSAHLGAKKVLQRSGAPRTKTTPARR